jgi:CHAT domain
MTIEDVAERWQRFQATHTRPDLEAAMGACEQLLAERPVGSPERAICLFYLGVGFRSLHDATRDLGYLNSAISALGQAVEESESGSADRAKYLNGLGFTTADLYERTRDRTQLEAAIAAFQQATDESPTADQRATNRNALGLHQRYLYKETWDLADLRAAIESLKLALDETHGDSPEQPARLSALGLTLMDLFERTNDFGDFQAAKQLLDWAVLKSPEDSPSWPLHLNNYGKALLRRWEYTGDPRDLDQAIEMFTDAVDSSMPGSAAWYKRQGNLGAALGHRIRDRADPADFDQAVWSLRKAIAGLPLNAPERLGCQVNLGGLWYYRYEQTGDPEQLNLAIAALEDVVDVFPQGSPEYPKVLANLADQLAARHQRSASADDLHRAVDCYRACCTRGLELGVERALVAALVWGRWAAQREDWEEAAEAYGYGLEALTRLFDVQLLRPHKEARLREVVGLPANVAYALAKAGWPDKAVVALERGRALLLNEALGRIRAEFGRLDELGHDELRARFEEIVESMLQLRRPSEDPDWMMVLTRDESILYGMQWGEAAKQAREELDATVAEIRRVPGFEEFLKPLTFEDLAAISSSAPLVYLAAAEVGGLGLLVRGALITPVWLPDLTEGTLGARTEAYRGALERHEADPAAFSAALEELTHWLWDAAMGPVLAALGPAPGDVVLVPAGLLGLLPLHAAWTEAPDDPECVTGRRYAVDVASLSYAPNAVALREARRLAERVPPASVLAVDEPKPVSAPPLPSAAYEAAAACAAFEVSARLPGERATREAVAGALGDARVLHLACHGRADLDEPLESGLLMAKDEPLTLRELFTLHLQARLAVLSACQTGLPGARLPDEVVGLPTGLLQAGVAGVVASLWAVLDPTTLLLMVGFYDRWRQGLAPAEALRQAQRWLRDTTNDDMCRWFEPLLDHGAATWLPRATVEACWETVSLEEPGERSFADPAGWAAFSYVGT